LSDAADAAIKTRVLKSDPDTHLSPPTSLSPQRLSKKVLFLTSFFWVQQEEHCFLLRKCVKKNREGPALRSCVGFFYSSLLNEAALQMLLMGA